MDLTENTINDLMASYLRSHGINILTQPSVRVGSSRRNPDFELRQTGIFYGEGEWQSSYVEGYNQAIEFGDALGCSGYFLIGYPVTLREQLRQMRLVTTDPADLLKSTKYRGMFKIEGQPVSLFRGSLQEIPDWIKRTLVQRERTEDPDEFVSLMRDLVRSLTNYLPATEKYPSFFEHIIASLPKDSGQVETAKQAAAFLLLNQIVFYSILSEGRGYPKIDPGELRKPEDLKGYFDLVLKDNYTAIFGSDVASIFPRTATGFIRDLIRIINLLEPEQFTRDLLGNVFHQLIPQEVRKPVAAYYTNPLAARLLARLAIQSPDDSVADFACGSGTLLMAAYERKAELIDHDFQEHDHKKFIERDITGIDIMPFAAHLAVIQLALNNPGYWTDEVRVAIYDSTNLTPGMRISSLQNMLPEGQTSLEDFYEGGTAYIEEGAVSPNGPGKGFSLGHVDVVIMNPPFTKKQFIKPDHREMLTKRFSDFKKYVNKEMAYWCYFILLADRFLTEGGRLALVLPASILRQVTYRNIRKLLCEKYSIHHVITTEFRSAFSESTLFREILLVAEKRKPEDDARTLFSLLNVLPNERNISDIPQALERSLTKEEDPMMKPFGETNLILHSDLVNSDDWFQFIPGEEPTLPELGKYEILSPLANVIPRMIQGLRLNRQELEMHPKTTMLSYDRPESTMMDWKILNETKRLVHVESVQTGIKVKIPKSVLVLSTRTASGMDKILVDKTYDYVVANRFRSDAQFWNDQNPDEIIPKRQRQIDSRSCHLFAAGRGNIDLTAPGTRLLAFCSKSAIAPTWAFWSMRSIPFEDACLLSLWWNSTYMLSQLIDIRTEVRGSRMWFSKKALQKLLILNPHKLSRDSRSTLLKAFEEVSQLSFPSLLDQLSSSFEGRLIIDKILSKVIGLEEFASDDELQVLYTSLAKKLSKMQTMMQRDSRS